MKTDTPALIHAYTRAEAIADGVLVEVHPQVSSAAGFRLPIAFTAASWGAAMTWKPRTAPWNSSNCGCSLAPVTTAKWWARSCLPERIECTTWIYGRSPLTKFLDPLACISRGVVTPHKQATSPRTGATHATAQTAQILSNTGRRVSRR